MDTTATQEVACVTRPRLELVVDERERQRLQELQRYNVLDTAPYVFPLLFRGLSAHHWKSLFSPPLRPLSHPLFPPSCPSPSLFFDPTVLSLPLCYTFREPCYDEIAQLAAHICQVPVALGPVPCPVVAVVVLALLLPC